MLRYIIVTLLFTFECNVFLPPPYPTHECLEARTLMSVVATILSDDDSDLEIDIGRTAAPNPLVAKATATQ